MCEASLSQHKVIYSPDYLPGATLKNLMSQFCTPLSYRASPNSCPTFSEAHRQSPDWDWVKNVFIFYCFDAYRQISGSGSLYPTEPKGGSHPLQFSLVKAYLNPQKGKAEPPVCV